MFTPEPFGEMLAPPDWYIGIGPLVLKTVKCSFDIAPPIAI
jgi:hypothetical protein